MVLLDAPPFFVDRHESGTVKAKVVGHQIPFPRGAVLVRKDLPYQKDLDVKTLQVDLHRGIAGDRFAYTLPLPVVPFRAVAAGKAVGLDLEYEGLALFVDEPHVVVRAEPAVGQDVPEGQLVLDDLPHHVPEKFVLGDLALSLFLSGGHLAVVQGLGHQVVVYGDPHMPLFRFAKVKAVQKVYALDVPALGMVVMVAVVLVGLAVGLLDDGVVEYHACVVRPVLLGERLDRQPKFLAAEGPARQVAGDPVVGDRPVEYRGQPDGGDLTETAQQIVRI